MINGYHKCDLMDKLHPHRYRIYETLKNVWVISIHFNETNIIQIMHCPWCGMKLS